MFEAIFSIAEVACRPFFIAWDSCPFLSDPEEVMHCSPAPYMVDDAGKETIETVRASYVIGADGGRSESSLIISAATCGSMSTHLLHTGVIRKFIGATFQGQTKDADGQVWAECEIEGLSDDVSTSCLRRAMQ